MQNPEQQSAGSLFEDCINIPLWLEQDRALAYRKRLHRDRRIGGQLPPSAASEAGRLKTLRFWWFRVRGAQDEQAGSKLNAARLLVTLLMPFLGAIAGVSLSLALFGYSGTRPVNVAPLVLVFGVMQVVLFLLSLLLFLPGRSTPVKTLQRLLTAINPAAFVATVMNAWAHRAGQHDPAPQVFRWLPGVARWQVLTWSHLAGVSFNVAALLTALTLITFTDLAFGWSTTLQLSALEFDTLVQGVSIPWRHWWPDAVPSLHLIEQSRFFRMDTLPNPQISAQSLTAWWPFVLACMTFYGFLPRITLLLISSCQLHHSLRLNLLRHPAVLALLERMRSQEVSLLDQAEAEIPEQSDSGMASVTRANPVRGPASVILWGQALDPEQVASLVTCVMNPSDSELTQVLHAGGGQTLAEDQASIQEVVNTRPGVVLFLVRAWEPPLNEVLDFLSMLDAELSDQVMLLVLPLGETGELSEGKDALVWQQTLARFSARLSVELAG